MPSWVPDWTSPFVSISPLTIRKRFGRLIKTKAPIESIGTPPVLGLIGDFGGTIEFVLDSQPLTVDLEATIDTVLQHKHLGRETAYDTNQVHVLLHGRLCTWFHEQGVAPLALSRIVPHRYYEDPNATFSKLSSNFSAQWLNLWNWIDFNVKKCSPNSGLSMPRIAVRTTNHDLDLVTALMLNMTDKSQPATFPGKQGGL